MLPTKYIVPIFVLCVISSSLAKPSEYQSEGRGIGSTVWGWVTYPFSWWSSGEPEVPNGPLIGTPIYGPYDNIEVAKHNVTVWCNDQTCTTMKCDKNGCKNVTCSIYDTDLRGECREYNTAVKPEQPTAAVTETTLQTNISEATTSEPFTSSTEIIIANQPVGEHPLELEAVLSSTVTEESDKGSPVKVDKTASPQNTI